MRKEKKSTFSKVVVIGLILSTAIAILISVGWSWIEKEYESSNLLIAELGIDEYTSEKTAWNQRAQIVFFEYATGAKKNGE
mmetsp:Transcript_16865/g.25385  ORF Transcript_16865/g.25385 Transcript_16865/m.25385 type:complete len:81 (-) Transcript_16865:1591-1833(-)